MLRTLTREIQESLGVVLTFAYSRNSLSRVKKDLVDGRSTLEVALDGIPKERAEHALIRLATLLRILDDQEEILRRFGERSECLVCGVIVHADDRETPLSFREFGNKVIHAKRVGWDFRDDSDPKVVAFASDSQRRRFNWSEARISLKRVAGVCGKIIS